MNKLMLSVPVVEKGGMYAWSLGGETCVWHWTHAGLKMRIALPACGVASLYFKQKTMSM